MTETNWEGEASEAPLKKKGMPKWLWFCGSGCLVMIVIVGVLSVFAVREVQKMVDPDTQWAELAEVLPYDEPRPDYTIIGMPMMKLIPGFDGMWTLMVSNQTSGSIMVFSGGEVEAADLFDPEQNEIDFGEITGNMGQFNFELETILVQGRELQVARFRSHELNEEGEEPADAAASEDEEEESGGFLDEMAKAIKKSVARVNLTPEDELDRVIVLEYAKQGTLERVSDEELLDFLESFHIGPDR
jgi:hypothetical protein